MTGGTREPQTEREARALREAERDSAQQTLSPHVQKILERTRHERSKMYGRKIHGPRARKIAAAEKQDQMDRAAEQIHGELSLFPRLSWSKLATKLWGEQRRFFPGGIPYPKQSTFNKEFRLALARYRRKHKIA